MGRLNKKITLKAKKANKTEITKAIAAATILEEVKTPISSLSSLEKSSFPVQKDPPQRKVISFDCSQSSEAGFLKNFLHKSCNFKTKVAT